MAPHALHPTPQRQRPLSVFLSIAWMAALLLPAKAAPAQTAPVPFKDEPHAYWTRPPVDAFTKLLANPNANRFQTPAAPLQTLQRILEALDIPVHSQLLVYSATSLQSGLIHPTNPRALYFNEEAYVGYVPGGRFEIASIDPQIGPIFYVSTAEAAPIQFGRTPRCMNCHADRASEQLPGLVAESVIVTPTGASLDGFRRDQVGHHIPLADRLGGWHVTGSMEHGPHLGNLAGQSQPGGYRKIANPPGSQFPWSNYLVQTSDLLPHLLHEHQLGFHNLVTLALYRTREALQTGNGSILPQDEAPLREIAHRIVRYLLFADETPLPPDGFSPLESYKTAFLSRRIPTQTGLSLRDLDLKSRLFKFRCSYMIYTPSFRALPQPMLARIRTKLFEALGETPTQPEFAYLPPDEKRTIRAILAETNALPTESRKD